MTFIDTYVQKSKDTSPIVVGIDPNFDLMPSFLKPNSADEVEDHLVTFCKCVIDACHGQVAAVKFQAAYFEQFGLAGLAALNETMHYAKKADLLIILDAKRGDIGSTSEAYARGYLEEKVTAGNCQIHSFFEADALTVNPFLGIDTLEPFIERAKAGKGIFLLLKTSNPGSDFIQNQILQDGQFLYQTMAKAFHTEGQKALGTSGLSNIGVVVGATKPETFADILQLLPNSPILIPGIGTQGGRIDELIRSHPKLSEQGLFCASRSITYPADISTQTSEYIKNIKQSLQNHTKMIN